MGGTCSTHGARLEIRTKFWLEHRNGREFGRPRHRWKYNIY